MDRPNWDGGDANAPGDRNPWASSADRTQASNSDAPGPDGEAAHDPRGGPILNIAPILAWTLIAIWVVATVSWFLPGLIFPALEPYLILSSLKFSAGPAANGGVVNMLAPLVGHMFLHADLLHLGMNSLWFLAFGAPVYRRLATGGEAPPGFAIGLAETTPHRPWPALLFVLFFLVSGIGGALAFIIVTAPSAAVLVGASGGVSGLLGGLALFMGQRGPLFSKGYRPLAPIFSRTVLVWAIAVSAVNIAVGVFGLGVGPDGPNIAWEAHLGGFFTGLVTFPLFDRLARRS